MLGSFDKTFDNMIYDRMEDLDMIILNNKEYIKLDEEIDKLFAEVKERLSDEHKNILSELMEVHNLQVSITRNIIYKQGLKDGIELKNILKLVI